MPIEIDKKEIILLTSSVVIVVNDFCVFTKNACWTFVVGYLDFILVTEVAFQYSK